MEDNDNALGGIIAGIVFIGVVVFSFVGAAHTNPTFWEDLTYLGQILIPWLFFVGAPLILALTIIILAKTTAAGIRTHANLFKKDEKRNCRICN